MGVSDKDIEKAFNSGDGDNDDGLSVSEAVDALNDLSGKSFDEDTIKSAFKAAGLDTSKELDSKPLKPLGKSGEGCNRERDRIADAGIADEFKTLVRHLEGEGSL